MATSSIANLFSFFTPSRPPQRPLFPPPSHISAVASNSSSNTYPRWSPLVLSNEAQSSPSCSSDVMHVVCPSLAYANTMLFSRPYHVELMVGEDEPVESLIRRFRYAVIRAGVFQEVRRRRFFENKQDAKKRKVLEERKQKRRRRMLAKSGGRSRFGQPFWQEPPEKKEEEEEEEEEDNSDYIPEELPY